MKDNLKECINCGGELQQIRTNKLQCSKCGHRYSVETQRDRYASIALGVFGFGMIVGLFVAFSVSII